MKLSEMWAGAWSGFLSAVKAEGIEIEADAVAPPATQEDKPKVSDDKPAVETSALETELAAQKAEGEALKARIAKMEADAQTARITALAASFGGETAAHVQIMQALGEDTPAYAAYVTQAKAHAEQERQSALFRAAGSAQQQSGGGGAWASIEAKAKALMNERPGLTIEQATMQVMDDDPALYAQYVSEQR